MKMVLTSCHHSSSLSPIKIEGRSDNFRKLSVGEAMVKTIDVQLPP